MSIGLAGPQLWLVPAVVTTAGAYLLGRRRWSPAPRWSAVAAVALFWMLNGVVVVLEPRLYRLAAFDRQYTVARVADYAEFPHTPDVVFMGDSRALSGFAPAVADAELGEALGRPVRTFNLSMTGARLNLEYLSLKNMISDDKKPSVVVLGLSEFAFVPLPGEDRTMTARFPLASTLLRWDDAEFADPGLAGEGRFALRNLVPLYRDSPLLRRALSVAFNPSDPAHQWYDGPTRWKWARDGSYIPGSGVRNPTVDDARNTYYAALQQFTLSPDSVHTLERILDLADRRHIRVVLVNMPVSEVQQGWWRDPAAMAEYRDTVRDVARRRGTSYLDAYDRMERQIPPEHFWDPSHLNLDGATILTRRVSRQYVAPLLRDG
ncbi:MAG: SGNH/GDSL hydrolase family protein [Actinomycetota bacterium]|nr:SGNH/GDSL hydrolase family protein [Actinomycetota bacterium]